MQTTLDLRELNGKIGRLFMAGIPGTALDADTEILIRDYCLGGVILFSRNIEAPVQLATLCNDLQNAAMGYHGIPLFLAVDQEGGRVARLREPFTLFPGNTAIGAHERAVEKALEFAHVTAKEMGLVGLNMNLAPVVDVPRGEPEKHLEGRTFGQDPKRVALLGRTVVKGLQEKGIMAVAKHFPGLGKTSLDPHHHLPTIEVDAAEMEEVNLPPFRAAIAQGVSGIMTSHAIYPFLDKGRPATLSPPILTGLLRERLGFDGLILSDDMEMGAIAKKWGVAEGTVAAFEAGADILLICEDQENVLGAIDLIRHALLSGEMPFEKLNQSLERIQNAKTRFLNNWQPVALSDVEEYFRVQLKNKRTP